MNRLAVALDGPNALSVYDKLRTIDRPLVFKLGLERLTAFDAEEVLENFRFVHQAMIDLKLHDIPNTVASAVKNILMLRSLHDPWITLHISGGTKMMQAASEAQRLTAPGKLLGVSVLTSEEATEDTAAKVLLMARQAQDAGLDGVVCSPHEAAAVRAQSGKDFLIITPGIRSASNDKNDQSRVMTAREAIKQGASAVVVGRPIMQAQDPVATALALLKEMDIDDAS